MNIHGANHYLLSAPTLAVKTQASSQLRWVMSSTKGPALIRKALTIYMTGPKHPWQGQKKRGKRLILQSCLLTTQPHQEIDKEHPVWRLTQLESLQTATPDWEVIVANEPIRGSTA